MQKIKLGPVSNLAFEIFFILIFWHLKRENYFFFKYSISPVKPVSFMEYVRNCNEDYTESTGLIRNIRENRIEKENHKQIM